MYNRSDHQIQSIYQKIKEQDSTRISVDSSNPITVKLITHNVRTLDSNYNYYQFSYSILVVAVLD
jgi:hypothetical protein